MLQKTIDAISTVVKEELEEHEGEIFKVLDRDEKLAIAANISIEGRPTAIDLTVKLSYTLEKRTITREEQISETQEQLFPQGKAVK